jgi:competence protein ComFC
MLLDFLFPKKCVQCGKLGDFLCPKCFSFLSFDVKILCLCCKRPTIDNLTHPGCIRKYNIDGTFSAIPYNKTAQRLIYSFKYKPYLSSLSEFLGNLLYESLIQNESFNNVLKSKKMWILVPIPLYISKFRSRGYNQSEILAKELGKKFGFEVQNLLTRTRETKNQFGLKVDERKKNIKGAFGFSGNKIEPKTGVFLVDDIVTTGSTLMEGAKVLKRNGASKVIGITLARD